MPRNCTTKVLAIMKAPGFFGNAVLGARKSPATTKQHRNWVSEEILMLMGINKI